MRAHSDSGEATAAPLGEGESGLFTQTWFPICLSSDVAPGEFKAYDFLDGRVLVTRDLEGKAQVLSAYCRHLGADLTGASMVDGTLRCPFHYWRYALDGRCVATGSGDPAPPAARLFRFPTVEKLGCVFAFNGVEPLFEIPDFPKPAASLRWKYGTYERAMHVDPWVICCNTPDMQHIKVVHGIEFDGGEPHDRVEWTSTSMVYRLQGRHRGGQPVDFRVGIYGSNIYFQEGEMDGRWFGFMAPIGLSRPKNSTLFLVVAVEDDPSDPAGTEAFLEKMYALEEFVASEDLPIVEHAHFRPGTLTRSDRTLARFLRYLREYPRAHPAANCIR